MPRSTPLPTSSIVRLYAWLLLSHFLSPIADSFSIQQSPLSISPSSPSWSTSTSSSSRTRTTPLFGGIGIAKTYTWNEEQYEIELKVTVPPNTKAKDINFTAKAKSIHLSLLGGDGDGDGVLLDGERNFRGQIDTDGTFWTIADEDEDDTNNATDEDNNGDTTTAIKNRQITITMEKFLVPAQDEFEVVEFDWGGIYPNDEDEIISKTYDEAEKLDVREYAASLGVDIDNINMTMVDKSMFKSGLNMTKDMMEELTDKGYAKEVTRQEDGREFVTDMGSGGTGNGEAVPFQSLGDGIGMDEIENAAGMKRAGVGTKREGGDGRPAIPFLDTPSPWEKSGAVVDAVKEEQPIRVDDGEATTPVVSDEGVDADTAPVATKSKDPIDSLTVVKLKEILRKENLKVSGKKQELRDRLKNHVRSIMIQKKNDSGDVLDDDDDDNL